MEGECAAFYRSEFLVAAVARHPLALCLQPQKWTVSDFSALNSTGEKLLPW